MVASSDVASPSKQKDGQTNPTERSQAALPRREYTWQEASKEAVVAWFLVVWKIALPLSINVLSMCLYYSPALIMTPSLLESVRFLVYDAALKSIWITSYWMFVALASVCLYSFEFTKKSMVIAILPIALIDHIMYLYPKINKLSYSSNISSILDLVFFGFSLLLVQRSKEPGNMTGIQAGYFRLTKDGTPWAMFKSLVGMYLLLTFSIYNILPVYVHSSFYIRVFFRFLLFPLCFIMCKWYQTRVIFNLSKDEMDKRLMVNKATNHYMQFIGRVFISNISTNNAASTEFIMVNAANSFLEFLHSVTIPVQSRIHHRAYNYISAFYNKIKTRPSNTQIVSVIPVDGNINPRDMDYEKINHTSEEEAFVQKTFLFHSRHMCDDIGSEIYSVILVPLLMYFINPLIPKSTNFQTLSSFRECLMQIFVQLVFEMTGDMFILAYKIKQGHLTTEYIRNWKPMNTLDITIWSAFCVVAMHSRILLLS